jgi:hypothetical protein
LYDKLAEIPKAKRPGKKIQEDYYKYVKWLSEYCESGGGVKTSDEKYSKYGMGFRKRDEE